MKDTNRLKLLDFGVSFSRGWSGWRTWHRSVPFRAAHVLFHSHTKSPAISGIILYANKDFPPLFTRRSGLEPYGESEIQFFSSRQVNIASITRGSSCSMQHSRRNYFRSRKSFFDPSLSWRGCFGFYFRWVHVPQHSEKKTSTKHFFNAKKLFSAPSCFMHFALAYMEMSHSFSLTQKHFFAAFLSFKAKEREEKSSRSLLSNDFT